MSDVFENPAQDALVLLARLGVPPQALEGGDLPARTPITGEEICRVASVSPAEASARIGAAHAASDAW
jgi:aldehyde dehydrogenase (NAD+)